MENTPRPRRSDRYQAQAAPSAQAAQPVQSQPVTQNPVQPTLSYPTQLNQPYPQNQPRSAAPAWYQQQTGYYTQLPNQRAPQRPAQQLPVRQAQAPGANPQVQYRRNAVHHAPSAVPTAPMGDVRLASAQREYTSSSRLPLWLTWTIVGLCIVLLGLLAAHYLMQAYLTTRAEEWETARQNTLSYYHVVEGENGNSITYQSLIERYAAEYNLRPAFVAAIIRNESSFRTDAESSVGARGLMQLMPDTAEWIAGKIGDSNYSFDHLYDAETNIRYGCWYLNYLSKLFRGDAVLVSSAYHAGQTTVTRWLSDKSISSDGVTIPVDKLPDGPTKQYAGRVTTSYGIYEALLYPNESAEAAGAAAGDIVSARAVRTGVANQ
mgnify:CR=1 FL=1